MKTISVITGNLFSIAASALGDPLQWINIARINGISDPFIYEPTQLYIPEASPAFSDGIGPQ